MVMSAMMLKCKQTFIKVTGKLPNRLVPLDNDRFKAGFLKILGSFSVLLVGFAVFGAPTHETIRRDDSFRIFEAQTHCVYTPTSYLFVFTILAFNATVTTLAFGYFNALCLCRDNYGRRYDCKVRVSCTLFADRTFLISYLTLFAFFGSAYTLHPEPEIACFLTK